MTQHRPRALAAAVLLLAVPLAIAQATAAHAAAPRYASPDGTGTVCSHKAPCGIVEAVDQAPEAADVVIEPGHYGTAAAPITTEITDASTSQLRVHGIADEPLPVIHSSADYAIRMLSSHVSYLKVIATGTTGGVLGTYGDHLDIEAANTSGPACTFNVMLSESLCVASGDATDGVSYTIPGSQLITIDNVTVIASGAHAQALAVHETGAALARVNVSSSILVGASYDVAVSAAVGGQAELNLSHSRYKTIAPASLHGGTRNINDVGGNIKATPKFVAAASGDYREKPGSKTVDAGTADPDFDTDLATEPRALGGGPDMGAYELLLPPKVTKLSVAKRTGHSIVVDVVVAPKGLPTKVRLVAKHGPHHSTSHVVTVGAGAKSKTVTLAVHGLQRATTYSVHATAHSDGGHADTSKKKISTS